MGRGRTAILAWLRRCSKGRQRKDSLSCRFHLAGDILFPSSFRCPLIRRAKSVLGASPINLPSLQATEVGCLGSERGWS